MATMTTADVDRCPQNPHTWKMPSMTRDQKAVTGNGVMADDIAARITRQVATLSECLINDRLRRATTDLLPNAIDCR